MLGIDGKLLPAHYNICIIIYLQDGCRLYLEKYGIARATTEEMVATLVGNDHGQDGGIR